MVDQHPAVIGARVPDHVGDRLLDDAEGGQIDLGGKRLGRPAPLDVDADAGVHRDGGQAAEAGQAGRRVQRPLPRSIAGFGPA